MVLLTGKDIVAIIRAGKESQVATLELKDVKVTYQGTESSFSQPITYQTSHQPTTEITPQVSTQLDDLDKHLLALTDPVLAEQMRILDEKA